MGSPPPSDPYVMRIVSFAALLVGVILMPTALGIAKLEHDRDVAEIQRTLAAEADGVEGDEEHVDLAAGDVAGAAPGRGVAVGQAFKGGGDGDVPAGGEQDAAEQLVGLPEEEAQR